MDDKFKEAVILLRLASDVLYKGDANLCEALSARLEQWLAANAPEGTAASHAAHSTPTAEEYSNDLRRTEHSQYFNKP